MPGPARTVSDSARKRQNAAQAKIRPAESVTLRIGSAIVEWNEIKLSSGFKTDEEVAKRLIACYKESQEWKRKKTSTMASSKTSSISGSKMEVQMSGIEGLSSAESDICSKMMDHYSITMEDTHIRRRLDVGTQLDATQLSKRKFVKKMKIAFLLTTFERWSLVKSSENLRTHDDVAVMLLDTWDIHQRLMHPTDGKPYVQSALDSHSVHSLWRQVAGVNDVPQSTLRLLRDKVGTRTDDQIVVKTEYMDEQPDVQGTEENTSSPHLSGEGHVYIDHCYQSASHAEVVKVKTEVVNDQTSSSTDTATDDNDNAMVDDISEKFMADIRDIVFDKRDKVLPVTKDNPEDTLGTSVGVRSTRIKSKGFRPNYAAFEWGESSNSDDSESDNDTDDKWCENEKKTSEILESDNSASVGSEHSNVFPGESKSVTKKRRRDSKGKQSKKINTVLGVTVDSDYLPSDEEDLHHEPSDVDGSNNEDDELDDEKDTSNQGDGSKKTKKVTAKKKWKTINLEDHTDKYCVEDVESFERQHRSNGVFVKSFSCLVCKRFKCTEKNVITTHIEKHVNKALECNKCDFIGAFHRELTDHQQTSGHQNVTYVCDICGLALKSSTQRRYHRGHIHNIPAYKCPFCKEMFVTGKLKIDHMRSLHPDVSRYCPACKKCFTLSAEKFEEHLARCTSIVQCETCGREMASKNLNEHVRRSHSNIRQFPCEFCRYSAKSKRSLTRHMMTHSDKFPYSCEQCAFSCRQGTQLHSHMRTHTGEKPFKCTQCKYAAAWNVQLKDHIKVHDMETAVMCKQCDVLFKNDNALKLHKKKAH